MAILRKPESAPEPVAEKPALTGDPNLDMARAADSRAILNEDGHAYVHGEHARVCPRCPDPA